MPDKSGWDVSNMLPKCSWDIDDVLSFSMVRMVEIKDRRLGGLNLCSQIAIVGYIVGYAIIYYRGYRKNAPASGFARLSVSTPSDEVYDAFYPLQQNRSCLPRASSGAGASKEYVTDFGRGQPNNVFNLDWPEFKAPQHPCAYWEVNEISRQAPNEVHLTTMRRAIQLGIPPENRCEYSIDRGCNMVPVGEPQAPTYTWLAEYHLLEIEHIAIAPELRLFQSASKFTGKMLTRKCKPNKSQVRPFICESVPYDPCDAYGKDSSLRELCELEGVTAGKKNTVTRIPIKAILNAAGFPSLDTWNGQNADGTPAEGPVPNDGNGTAGLHTSRENGLEIVLQIEYRNDEQVGNDDAFTFSILPFVVEGLGSRINQTTVDISGNNMTIVERSGLSIRVVQLGTVGAFDFQALLTSLVTSIALLAVSSTIVQVIALNCCPLKALYRYYKTAVTPDLYDLKGLNEAVMARLETEDLINPRPAILFEAGPKDDDGTSGVEAGARTKRGVRDVTDSSGTSGMIEMSGGLRKTRDAVEIGSGATSAGSRADRVQYAGAQGGSRGPRLADYETRAGNGVLYSDVIRQGGSARQRSGSDDSIGSALTDFEEAVEEGGVSTTRNPLRGGGRMLPRVDSDASEMAGAGFIGLV